MEKSVPAMGRERCGYPGKVSSGEWAAVWWEWRAAQGRHLGAEAGWVCTSAGLLGSPAGSAEPLRGAGRGVRGTALTLACHPAAAGGTGSAAPVPLGHSVPAAQPELTRKKARRTTHCLDLEESLDSK